MNYSHMIAVLSARRSHSDLQYGEYYNCSAERLCEFWRRIGESEASIAEMRSRVESFCYDIFDMFQGKACFQVEQDVSYDKCISLNGTNIGRPNIMISWELVTVNGESDIDQASLHGIVSTTKANRLIYVPESVLDEEVNAKGFESSCRHLLFDYI